MATVVYFGIEPSAYPIKNIFIMKPLITLLLFITLNAQANTHSVENFVNAKINLLEVQITQLTNAIALMQSNISDTEQYKLIAQPSFTAIENSLDTFAFNVKSYYKFAANNRQTINDHLHLNNDKANYIKQLEIQLEIQTQVFDGIKQ